MKDFTKEDTKIVKGFAVIFMLWHHICFQQRIPRNSLMSIFGTKLFTLGTLIGSFCISLFMFMGGYGTYLQYKNGKLKIVKKIYQLYVAYWQVFCVFVPIGYVFFRWQSDYCVDVSVCHVFENLTLKRVLLNFFGVYTDINAEQWFFYSYVIVLLIFPMISKIIKANTFKKNLLFVLGYLIFIQWIFPYVGKLSPLKLENNILYKRFIMQETPWTAIFWLGCAFAKDDVLVKLRVIIDHTCLAIIKL